MAAHVMPVHDMSAQMTYAAHGMSAHVMSAQCTWHICRCCRLFWIANLSLPRLEKKTAIRRIAVRETSVSRYHRGPIEGPPKVPHSSHHYRIEGFKGAHKS